MYKNYIFLLIFFIIIIAGCKKDPSSIGLNVHPPGDITKTFFTDTITISAFTFADDSITSDERTLNLLGSYIDPVFGLSTASFLTQFRSPSNIPFTSSNLQADSLVLYLKYNSYYGDIITTQNIVVYELTKSIDIVSTYYSNKNVSQYYDSLIEIANKTFIPNPNESVLAITLSSSLANKLLNTSLDALSDNSAFIEYFKGLYIKANNFAPSSSILYFNLLAPETKLTLYYKDTTASLNYSFVVNSNCARFNLFSHDYSNANFYSHLNDAINQDSVVYIQSMAGVKVKVNFPYIASLKNLGKIAINKAQLVIYTSDNDISDTSKYHIPSKLLALMPDTAVPGGYNFLPDYNVGQTYFDGNYYSDEKSYKFNITLYIQDLIDNPSNTGIFLFTAENRISANRAVLTSGKNSKPMKLRITYTKL